MPKVLLINGSPHARGCTWVALNELQQTLERAGVETHLLHVGHLPMRGCTSCGFCRDHDHCV